jgi:hypothetical protein
MAHYGYDFTKCYSTHQTGNRTHSTYRGKNAGSEDLRIRLISLWRREMDELSRKEVCAHFAM